MKFDVTRFTVRAGARVHVSFHSNATLGVLPHNWVLVKSGNEAAVALAGLSKGAAAGYVEQGPDVLASTSLAQPGQTVETTFVAPAPGTYSYICTVPGHYLWMRGKLIVTAS
jgi:azurin